MKRSWFIDVLVWSSVASAALLLFSFLNDLVDLAFHSYLLPTTLTEMLWNVIGLLPSAASLIGVVPHILRDPILTLHTQPVTLCAVHTVTAMLSLIQAYGLRRRQIWALYTTLVLCAVDFLVQGCLRVFGCSCVAHFFETNGSGGS